MAKKKKQTQNPDLKKETGKALPPATLDTLDAMLSDVFVRTSGGVSRLFTGLSGVYNAARSRMLAGLDQFGSPGVAPAKIAASMELFLRNTLCAFKDRPLPSLEDRLCEAVRQSLGLQGRPGISPTACTGVWRLRFRLPRPRPSRTSTGRRCPAGWRGASQPVRSARW